MHLTAENFKKGMLIDEELMGGISENSAKPGVFTVFVLRHLTGEYLGHQEFARIDEALAAINSVKRDWKYEQTGGCGGGKCGEGLCGQGQCTADQGTCPTGVC